MSYKIYFTKTFEKQLSKLDKNVRNKIIDYIENVIAELEDPRKLGKMLSGDFLGYYRYRVGDYRLICEIIDEKITISMISVAHRKDCY